MTTQISDIERVTVPPGVLKKLLSVKDDSRVRQLAGEGIFIRASKGRYLLFESIQNYIKTLKIQKDISHAESEKDIDYETERAKHEQIKRMQSELKLALMKGELQMPTKIAPFLTNKTDILEVKQILTEEIKDILQELKEYDPKDFYSNDFVELGESYE